MVQRIRNEGEEAEQRFDDLVTSSGQPLDAKLGDRTVRIGADTHHIEIKRCRAPADKSGTINQVRAIKFIPMAIWAPVRDVWYVISPGDLVRMAASKSRGQHTEIPFECMNLSLPAATSRSAEHWLKFQCADEDLEEAVNDAILAGSREANLKAAMSDLLAELKGLRSKYQRLAL